MGVRRAGRGALGLHVLRGGARDGLGVCVPDKDRAAAVAGRVRGDDGGGRVAASGLFGRGFLL